jgi:NitT/TauT family transport system permease protein/sulfonate transport system permease protein
MYVGICVVAVMGFLFSALIRWIGNFALPWTRPARAVGTRAKK